MVKKRRSGKVVPKGVFEATIDSLASDARGVARVNGKATFIDGALPGETIRFEYTRCRSKYDEGVLYEILSPSADRVTPKCEYISTCGGCSLQHLSAAAQIQMKQQTLLDSLSQMANVEPLSILPPLSAAVWGYRRRARLGVQYDKATRRVLLGFREKKNHTLTDIKSCEVLHASVGQLLQGLSHSIAGLHMRRHITQIEVAVSDDLVALVFWHLIPLDEHDQQQLIAYAKENSIAIYLQSDTAELPVPLWPQTPRLRYRLDAFDITLEYLPGDFIQANASINQAMVQRAVAALGIHRDDQVLDLFCGLGNFTLAIAQQAANVAGVEADQHLIDRASSNAHANQLANISFYAADLYADITSQAWFQQPCDKLLLDPPRAGAQQVVEHMDKLNPQRIVYISCHPGTLARDTAILVDKAYRLLSVGVMDMFPHTTHVESIAVFEKA